MECFQSPGVYAFYQSTTPGDTLAPSSLLEQQYIYFVFRAVWENNVHFFYRAFAFSGLQFHFAMLSGNIGKKKVCNVSLGFLAEDFEQSLWFQCLSSSTGPLSTSTTFSKKSEKGNSKGVSSCKQQNVGHQRYIELLVIAHVATTLWPFTVEVLFPFKCQALILTNEDTRLTKKTGGVMCCQ